MNEPHELTSIIVNEMGNGEVNPNDVLNRIDHAVRKYLNEEERIRQTSKAAQ